MTIYSSILNRIMPEVREQEHSGLLHCGRINRAVGLTLEAKGFHQPVGVAVM